MLPQICSYPCNQSLTSFIWVHPLAKLFSQHANSIIWMLNRIPSWIPAAWDRSHSCPLGQYIIPDTPIGRFVLKKELFEFPLLIFQGLMWTNHCIAACTLIFWMVTENARHWILNFHFNDHSNCCGLCCNCHKDRCHGLIMFKSCQSKKMKEQEKCGIFVSCYNNAASNEYENIKEVTWENINECIVNELEH